jgi:hypothetical protein
VKHNTILSVFEASVIRMHLAGLRATGADVNLSAIGRAFGVTHSSIRAIELGRTFTGQPVVQRSFVVKCQWCQKPLSRKARRKNATCDDYGCRYRSTKQLVGYGRRYRVLRELFGFTDEGFDTFVTRVRRGKQYRKTLEVA